MDVLHSFRRYLTKPHVRPWALSSPILVLLVCTAFVMSGWTVLIWAVRDLVRWRAAR